jgi:hypothetical protein
MTTIAGWSVLDGYRRRGIILSGVYQVPAIGEGTQLAIYAIYDNERYL